MKTIDRATLDIDPGETATAYVPIPLSSKVEKVDVDPMTAAHFEVIRADYIGRNILIGLRVIFAIVAHAAPVVEAVETRCARHLMLQGRPARETRLLPGTQVDPRTLSVGLALAAPHSHRGRVGIRIDVEPVITRLQNRESLVGRINLVGFAAEQMADVQIQRALIEFHLHDVVTDVGQCEAGLGTRAQRGAAQV